VSHDVGPGAILDAMDRAAHHGPPSPRTDAGRDHVVVLRDVPWEQYQSLLRARGRSRRPRFAYLDGVLEIMTTGIRHEFGKTLVARLIEAYAEENVALNGAGNTTFHDEAEEAGLEPDECYFIGKIKPVPDIALEVVETSGGIDKLEIYRRLGVPEVWFWIGGRFWIYIRGKRGYTERPGSALLPKLDLDEVARVVLTFDDDQQTAAVRVYRQRLRRRRR
jgi:Uma2 family endonuclease